MLGRYGLRAIDEPAGLAWPTLEDLEDAQEYERVAFPLSLQERWKKLEEARQENVKCMIERYVSGYVTFVTIRFELSYSLQQDLHDVQCVCAEKIRYSRN